MRVAVISALGTSMGGALLADLGCSVREVAATAPPAELVRDATIVVVEAAEDGELGGFVVRRARSSGASVPLLLVIDRSQLTRMDPSWGHDDFLVLPYEPHEVVARLRALEWQTSEFAQPERIKIGPLVLDLAAREATVSGARISLANREYELLVYLARRRGRVVPREQLLAQVFGVRREGASRSLDVHVRRLRAKLGTSVALETARGVGYKLAEP